MITDRVTQDVVGKASGNEFFFLLIVKFGDKLAAALPTPGPNKTSSQKIATANFHHVKVK